MVPKVWKIKPQQLEVNDNGNGNGLEGTPVKPSTLMENMSAIATTLGSGLYSSFSYSTAFDRSPCDEKYPSPMQTTLGLGGGLPGVKEETSERKDRSTRSQASNDSVSDDPLYYSYPCLCQNTSAVSEPDDKKYVETMRIKTIHRSPTGLPRKSQLFSGFIRPNRRSNKPLVFPEKGEQQEQDVMEL